MNLEKEEELKASEEFAKKLQEEELQMDEQLLKDGEMAEQLQYQELEKVHGAHSKLF